MTKQDKIVNLEYHILFLKRDMSSSFYTKTKRLRRIAIASYLILYLNGSKECRRDYINNKFISLLNDWFIFNKRSEKYKYPDTSSRFLLDRF